MDWSKDSICLVRQREQIGSTQLCNLLAVTDEPNLFGWRDAPLHKHISLPRKLIGFRAGGEIQIFPTRALV